MEYFDIGWATRILRISKVWLRRLVYEGRITAYYYDEHAQLCKREPHQRPAQLFFAKEDLDAYQKTRRLPGRPDGTKNKKPRRKSASRA